MPHANDPASQLEVLRSLFENTDEPIVICNAAGEIILFNAAARKIYGHPRTHVLREVQQSVRTYVADGSRMLALHERPISRALQGEDVRDFPLQIQPVLGPRRDLLIDAHPLRSDQGEIIGAVAKSRVAEKSRGAAG